MKNILMLGLAICVIVGSLRIFRSTIKDWTEDKQADGELLQSDSAIPRAKSWRLRIRRTDARFPEPWIVSEAILPDRERALANAGSSAAAGGLKFVDGSG